MEEFNILPNIEIAGQEEAVAFVLELRELVESYNGYLEFDPASDVDMDIIVMTEEDEPCEMTLDDYMSDRR